VVSVLLARVVEMGFLGAIACWLIIILYLAKAVDKTLKNIVNTLYYKEGY
jgi:hypothetical protein